MRSTASASSAVIGRTVAVAMVTVAIVTARHGRARVATPAGYARFVIMGRPAAGVYEPTIVSPRRRVGRREFDFTRQVAVMAIVNRTPDSFHDQGRTFALEAAVTAVRRAVSD